MIELLRNHICDSKVSPDNPFAHILNIEAEGPASNEEIQEKINEIINYLNNKETE